MKIRCRAAGIIAAAAATSARGILTVVIALVFGVASGCGDGQGSGAVKVSGVSTSAAKDAMWHISVSIKCDGDLWLDVCKKYVTEWNRAISVGRATPAEVIEREQSHYRVVLSSVEKNVAEIKTYASQVQSSGTAEQRAVALDCVGAISELADMVRSPRGSLVEYSAKVSEIEGRMKRLRNQVDVLAK